MDIDIKELIKTATENLNLKNFKGDVVAVKVVENEFGTIEEGAIGVQNVYYGADGKKVVNDGSTPSNDNNPTSTEHEHPVTEIALSDADKALHKRLMAYVANGDWQSPATFDNVRQWISILFGADMKELDAEDVEKTRKFRDFFKGGKAGANTDRVEVSMANILGYLMSFQLLAGGQKQISIDFFGNDGQVNNINKGKNKDGNQDFKSLLPLMDKYREKIIGG